MKILNSINEEQKNETLANYDSPIFSILGRANFFLIWLSAISVSAGIIFQFMPENGVKKWIFLFVVLLFTVAWAKYIDGTSAKGIEWLTNSFQKKEFWVGKEKIRTSVLSLFMIIVVFFMTALSLKLSKSSAEKAADFFSRKEKITNIISTTTDKEEQKNKALSAFDERSKEAEKRAEKEIEAINKKYDAKIKVYEGYLQNASSKEAKNRQLNNIARQEAAKLNEIKPINEALKAELTAINEERKEESKRLSALNDQIFTETTTGNQKAKKENEEFKETFKKLFGFIAGYSIIIALLLSSILALMKARAGIEPTPIWEASDYKDGTIIELLKTPFVIIERIVLNIARLKKHKLKDLMEPEKMFSYNTFTGEHTPIEESENRYQGNEGNKEQEMMMEKLEDKVKDCLIKSEYQGDAYYITAYKLIKMYLLTDDENTIAGFIEECILHYKGEGENPFHRQRRQIGYIQNDATRNATRNASSGSRYDFSENNAENAENALRNGGNNVKICKSEGCGKTFTPTVPHHKYCSDACRQVANGLKNRT